jgi:hypothetical protein
MSQGQGEAAQQAVKRVIDCAAEPCYLSEIARKLNTAFDTNAFNVEKVAQVASVISDRDGIEFYDVGYEDNGGQSIGSMHYSNTSGEGIEETKEWRDHTVIHNENPQYTDIEDAILEVINPSISVEDKVMIIDILSGRGNFTSEAAEKIMQDSFARQFREYDVVQFGDYNDPGIDFVVDDPSRRDFGLAVEVSTRWENPIGTPYMKTKEDAALEEDLDLVILAPIFREKLLQEYEQKDDDRWHKEPEGEIVHLHEVPNDRPGVYRPFAKEPVQEEFLSTTGFPVIVPDDERTRNRLRDTGHIGDNYPVVDSDLSSFREALDRVERDFELVTESEYRTQLRESIEPLLYEFTKPYRIEQYLIDTYWKQTKSTEEIGRLNDVSGRTIRRWLSEQNWDIVTRGTGTDLSDETLEIWRRMYEGEDPFPEQMTGYDVQSMYNRHPQFTLDDWRQWFNTEEDLRDELTRQMTGPLSSVGYTILIGNEERIFPSYSFIINQLREVGVDIREGFTGESGTVTPTGLALEYMINRQTGNLNQGQEPDGRNTVDMRSSLEVEVGEWFSENKIPYAYEPWQIPSSFSNVTEDVTDISQFVSDNRGGEVENTWRRIYEKHELGSQGDVGVDEGLDRFDTQSIIPDFVTYLSAGKQFRDRSWDMWDNWDHIIEIAGLYGLGLQRSWESWYRVRGVAFKELALKVLGLWSQSYFVVPNAADIPQGVVDDDSYIIIDSTQTGAGLESIGERLNIGQ